MKATTGVITVPAALSHFKQSPWAIIMQTALSGFRSA